MTPSTMLGVTDKAQTTKSILGFVIDILGGPICWILPPDMTTTVSDMVSRFLLVMGDVDEGNVHFALQAF